uniref:Uncharacterized protein LOC111110714 isoform X2 n=1 Tax=Crassostrea virginica TaxID=6565 RepID=A0A8B8BIB3_CRAVI|nr:uncharacterized protein LOC111110714 isoform X2 [Crassostrea virginica]
MDARKGFFVLLALSVTSLVSGYANYRRMRPVSKTVYRRYLDKYRTYRNPFSGFNPKRRPFVRSLGQYFGGDFQLQRSLPRFKAGFQKGDKFFNKGSRGVMIRPIPIFKLPPPLRSFKTPSYRPNPIQCPKFETLVCSLAPYNIRSSKCFSLCRNGKPCYKPCSCTCVPFIKGNSKGSKLLPLGKKSTIPFCKKTQILRCKAQKYSAASDGLCARACADGVCPVSCNCQCIIDRAFFGGGGGGFRNNGRGVGGTRGFQGGLRGGQEGGFRGGNGGGRGGVGGGRFVGGGGGGFGGNGFDGGVRFGGDGGIGGRFGDGGGRFGENGFDGGLRFGGGGGIGGRFGDGGGRFGGNGFDNGAGFDGIELRGGGGFAGDVGFGRNVGFGVGGDGFNIGQGDNGFNGQGSLGGIGIDNGINFGNGIGFDNGVGIGDGIGGGAGLGGGITGVGEGLGIGGEGLGLGLGAGSGLDFGGGLDAGVFDGGVDLGMGISNDVAITDRDFRSFPNNGPGQLVPGQLVPGQLVPGQLVGLGSDQEIPIDFSKLQAIERLDFPLDGSQRIPEMLEPELSLMDNLPEMNGPALIDPGLGVGSSGQFFGVGSPEIGAVGVDSNALQELGGLVGGPFDPILDIGAGRARSSKNRKSKTPKKVTETVDIKVDVIKKGGKASKKPGKGNDKGLGPGMEPGFSRVGIPSGAAPSGGGLLPGDIVDPSAFLGGSNGGGQGNGGMLDGGFLDAGAGGFGMDQGGLPPIGILFDGQQPGGPMSGAGSGGVPREFGGGPRGNADFRGGPQDALGIDAMAGIPPSIDLQGGHFEPEMFPGNGNQGSGGKSGIIGFDGFGGAGHSGGLALDALPLDAGFQHGGSQAFENNALIDPMIQASNGFNEQMTFVDPTQPNGGPPGGELPMDPGSQQGGISGSGGNINLDLASLLPADVLGGLDLNGGSNANSGVKNRNFGGPGEPGHSGGVIGIADLSAGGAARDIGGASIGKGVL